jgi:hypothetical protein
MPTSPLSATQTELIIEITPCISTYRAPHPPALRRAGALLAGRQPDARPSHARLAGRLERSRASGVAHLFKGRLCAKAAGAWALAGAVRAVPGVLSARLRLSRPDRTVSLQNGGKQKACAVRGVCGQGRRCVYCRAVRRRRKKKKRPRRVLTRVRRCVPLRSKCWLRRARAFAADLVPGLPLFGG